MNYDEYTINFKGNVIHYCKFTGGNEVLLAFHGFGQSKEIFSSIAEKLVNYFTIYALDLFFHGKSIYNFDEQPLSIDTWKEIIKLIREKHNISSFSICGYSLGARFALVTLYLFPRYTNTIFLIAPDGIFVSKWYKLAVSCNVTRFLLKFNIKKPIILHVLKGINFFRLLNPQITKFVIHNLDSIHKRKQVYFSWIVFRNLILPQKTLLKIFKCHEKKIILFVGKYDLLYPKVTFIKLVKKYPNIVLLEVNANHTAILPAVADYLALAGKLKMSGRN